jgi:hypothetical protein
MHKLEGYKCSKLNWANFVFLNEQNWREKKGEGYRKKKVIKNKVIANNKDFSRFISLYKIHVLGVSKYIIFTKRI